ncbi:unnamed protein product, partial [Meganyctiphanes norvegica]
MVFGVKPKCTKCDSEESTIWQKDEKDQVLCTECFHSHSVSTNKKQLSPKGKQKDEKGKLEDEIEIKQEKDDEKPMEIDEKDADESNGNGGKDEDHDGDREKDSSKNEKKETKRKTRKGRQGNKGNIPKGKGRRYIFKKSATKAPTAVATPVTSQYLFYKNSYFKVKNLTDFIGFDRKTGKIGHIFKIGIGDRIAHITLFMHLNFTTSERSLIFRRQRSVIGPEEDIPRKLEYMEFVCHAPSDYFKDRTSPYSTQIYQPHSCFVWTRMGPQIKPIEKAKELMAK